MDNFDDIKAIWQSEQGDQLPSAEHITGIIQKHKRHRQMQLALVIAGMAGCAGLMTTLVVWHPYHIWTTSVGTVLFILAALFFIAIKFRTMRNRQTNELLDNEQYLQQLQQNKPNHYQRFSWRLLSAFALWIVAASFYLYEAVAGSTSTLITGYSGLLAVILCAWFVYRPWMAKRYWEKNESFIKQIEILKQQLQCKE